jgi:hypothetical protein
MTEEWNCKLRERERGRERERDECFGEMKLRTIEQIEEQSLVLEP